MRNALKKLKKNADSTKIIKAKLLAIDEKVKNFKLDYMKNNPATFLTKVFKASEELEIPEAPILQNGKKDSTFAYKYYIHHYFDNIDFSDDRLLRTPIFNAMLKQFITTVVPFGPDTVIKLTDTIVEKSRANKEVFKYVVWYITNWSETCEHHGI